jgi:hypothetical protein
MATKWVVVAESSRVLAFQQAGLAMEELEGLMHPASRAHERDLISDRPGRSFDSFGSGRHAMEEEVSLKQREAIVAEAILKLRSLHSSDATPRHAGGALLRASAIRPPVPLRRGGRAGTVSPLPTSRRCR